MTVVEKLKSGLFVLGGRKGRKDIVKDEKEGTAAAETKTKAVTGTEETVATEAGKADEVCGCAGDGGCGCADEEREGFVVQDGTMHSGGCGCGGNCGCGEQ